MTYLVWNRGKTSRRTWRSSFGVMLAKWRCPCSATLQVCTNSPHFVCTQSSFWKPFLVIPLLYLSPTWSQRWRLIHWTVHESFILRESVASESSVQSAAAAAARWSRRQAMRRCWQGCRWTEGTVAAGAGRPPSAGHELLICEDRSRSGPGALWGFCVGFCWGPCGGRCRTGRRERWRV